MHINTFKYLTLFALLLVGPISYSQILCEEEVPFSTNSAYIQFAESALKIDDTTYFEDDVFINALYKNKTLGMQCSGFIRYNKGLPFTMALTGKDAFVTNGFTVGDGIFLVLQKEDGCILDSLKVTLDGTNEITDSLVFQINKVIKIKSLSAKTGDCLLTTTPEISNLTSIKIFPNPTSERINIQFSLSQPTKIHLNLTNLMGQILESRQIEGVEIVTELKVAHLPEGTYYLVLNNNGQLESQKIIILK